MWNEKRNYIRNFVLNAEWKLHYRNGQDIQYTHTGSADKYLLAKREKNVYANNIKYTLSVEANGTVVAAVTAATAPANYDDNKNWYISRIEHTAIRQYTHVHLLLCWRISLAQYANGPQRAIAHICMRCSLFNHNSKNNSKNYSNGNCTRHGKKSQVSASGIRFYREQPCSECWV